ncbi:MAG: hypothetical protein PHR26_01400 [Candidatus ainarchaeum sp.]|nr:hypothetical protein [Candidatus ainarchaeum sp.]MDD3976294.1 hypothetical protein [Candidatus ainarchaeum sp.]
MKKKKIIIISSILLIIIILLIIRLTGKTKIYIKDGYIVKDYYDKSLEQIYPQLKVVLNPKKTSSSFVEGDPLEICDGELIKFSSYNKNKLFKKIDGGFSKFFIYDCYNGTDNIYYVYSAGSTGPYIAGPYTDKKR